MANLNHIFLAFAVVLVSYFSFCSCNEINCINKESSENSCVCQFANGSIIDLKTVGLISQPKFENKKAVKDDGYKYSYNPCYSFSEGPEGSGCYKGVAACQSKGDKEFYDIGVQSSAKFFENGSSIVIQYISNAQAASVVRTTNVTLVCDTNTDLVVLGEQPPNSAHFEMELHSPCACLNGCVKKAPDEGLSTGSVLVILLFTFILCYLIGGIIYQKIIRGATGYELIPNLEFWLEFPLLVRDGCLFCKNGCNTNTRTTYDTI